MFKKLKWVLKGKIHIIYVGANCGLCGKWIDEAFLVPEYQSIGSWIDTWDICEDCLDGKYIEELATHCEKR